MRLSFLIIFISVGFNVEKEFYIFSRENTPSLLKQCSRSVPYVTSTWKVDEESIGKLKSDFELIKKVKEKIYRDSTLITYSEGQSITELSEYHYQIGGVIVKSEKVLYINAFHQSLINDSPQIINPKSNNLEEDAVIFCDGGDSFWGILYNPKTRKFSSLSINGY